MPLNILLVEDDIIIKMFIENIIKRAGCTLVGHAQSGLKAISMALEKRPDLILMDIGIKGELDGVVTSAKIKEELNSNIIFITGNSDEATVNRARSIDPLQIIHKPIDEEKLLNDLIKICASILPQNGK
ncbi:response regulator [Paracrocinitomix mangrovi]|uniref:response regulator n=1 Tax=Paracrocinitomix mangrovi TaxID=2862509 RepID=UPI001C8ED53A|nr:response regulator [Paracrocinitomix mangrovi]UKN01995.1 response regulator [Paracrocinitomix mangrovi]